jgi:nucleotide-binding universal stress UspA family protein
MFQQIVVATDGSEQALQAARVAGELAHKFQAKLTLLSVFDMSDTMVVYESGTENIPYVEVMRQMGEEMHERVQQRTGNVLQKIGVTYDSRCETGHPVDTIVRVAEE